MSAVKKVNLLLICCCSLFCICSTFFLLYYWRTVVCWLCFLQIISRYSVVVMLEVVDSSGKAMDKLLTELNNSTWAHCTQCSTQRPPRWNKTTTVTLLVVKWYKFVFVSDRGNRQHPYAMKKSRRLGRSTYKEQFVYFYKWEKVS